MNGFRGHTYEAVWNALHNGPPAEVSPEYRLNRALQALADFARTNNLGVRLNPVGSVLDAAEAYEREPQAPGA